MGPGLVCRQDRRVVLNTWDRTSSHRVFGIWLAAHDRHHSRCLDTQGRSKYRQQRLDASSGPAGRRGQYPRGQGQGFHRIYHLTHSIISLVVVQTLSSYPVVLPAWCWYKQSHNSRVPRVMHAVCGRRHRLSHALFGAHCAAQSSSTGRELAPEHAWLHAFVFLALHASSTTPVSEQATKAVILT